MSEKEPLLVIHTRLPQRLVKVLNHYAAERGQFRYEAESEILEYLQAHPEVIEDMMEWGEIRDIEKKESAQ